MPAAHPQWQSHCWDLKLGSHYYQVICCECIVLIKSSLKVTECIVIFSFFVSSSKTRHVFTRTADLSRAHHITSRQFQNGSLLVVCELISLKYIITTRQAFQETERDNGVECTIFHSCTNRVDNSLPFSNMNLNFVHHWILNFVHVLPLICFCDMSYVVSSSLCLFTLPKIEMMSWWRHYDVIMMS